VICDTINSELLRRSGVCSNILSPFKALFISKLTENETELCLSRLNDLYKDDIDVNQLKSELIQFLNLTEEEEIDRPLEMYKLLLNGLRSTFRNTKRILKIFLTMPVSNASGEHSFSVLKRIKNYLRSTLSRNKTSSLSFLFNEHDIVKDIDYNDLIDSFAKQKARKILL
jgi:hypothetical protein